MRMCWVFASLACIVSRSRSSRNTGEMDDSRDQAREQFDFGTSDAEEEDPAASEVNGRGLGGREEILALGVLLHKLLHKHADHIWVEVLLVIFL